MSKPMDRDYFEKRARESLAASERATDPCARLTHARLAEAYRKEAEKVAKLPEQATP